MENFLETTVPTSTVIGHYCTIVEGARAHLLVPTTPKDRLSFRLVWRCRDLADWETMLTLSNPSLYGVTRGRRSRPIQRMLRTVGVDACWERVDPHALLDAMKAESTVGIYYLRETCAPTDRRYFSVQVSLFNNVCGRWESEKFDTKEQVSHPYFKRHPNAPY